MQLPVSLLDPISLKIKKSTPKKNSLDFRKWNFLALRLKKTSYIFSKQFFSYIPGNGTFLYFGKRNLLDPRLKKFRKELSELEK